MNYFAFLSSIPILYIASAPRTEATMPKKSNVLAPIDGEKISTIIITIMGKNEILQCFIK